MTRSPLWFRRLLVGGVSTLTVGGLAMTGLLSTAGTAGATSTFKITQLAGSDRFATAAAIATAAFPNGAGTVIVASGLQTNLPDALAASYLAAQQNGGKGAPILLVNANSVPAETAQAILTLKATNIIIVGGTDAVTASVESTLTNNGAITVSRVAGTDRFLTADAIDSQTGDMAVGPKKTAIIADGVNANLVDALGASPLAAAGPYPMFLVNGPTGDLSATDLSIMATDGITNAITVGGSAAIGPQIATELTAANITSVNESGSDRSATSEALANYEISNYGFSKTEFNIAGGAQPNLVDALTGGPLGGMEMAPTLITDSPTNAGSVTAFATANAATENSANLFGGSAGVSATTEAAIVSAAQSKAAVPTSLPTLVSASITGTNPVSGSFAGQTGTVVQYVFNQSLTGITPAVAGFHVYTSGDGETTGTTTADAVVDSTNSDAVDVRYPSLATATEASTLTLATVSGGAVTTAAGANPDGSEPIGSSSTTTASAGVTTAPDLVSAVANGAATTTKSTAVNVTFDKDAYVQAGAIFQLILTDGTLSNCTAPDVGTSTPSGGSVPGGNGTTTLTLVCANDTSAQATTLTSANIARAIDNADAVSTTSAAGGATNQAEATVTPNVALSTNPDLTGVAVHLKVGASATTDSIVYTFNGPVTIPTSAAGFNAITSAAGLVPGGTVDSSSTSTSIVIDYTDPALSSVVGGSVTAATVTSPSLAKSNLFNERGVSNSTTTTVTPGTVAAPQLTSASLTPYTNGAGTSVDGVTFTFTQPVVTTALTAAQLAALHVYDANGTELTCSAATASGSSVDCTTFVATVGGAAATTTELSGAVLATADNSAVTGLTAPNTGVNPEGAATI